MSKHQSARTRTIARFMAYAADPEIESTARESFLTAALRYRRMTDEEYLTEINQNRVARVNQIRL